MVTFRRVADSMCAEPFRPFRISMASGESYDIHYPEMIALGRTTIRVFTLWSDDPEEAKEQKQVLPILLIESIEPLDTAARSDGS